MITAADPMEELLKLDVIKALTMGSAAQFSLPRQPWGILDNLALDRSHIKCNGDCYHRYKLFSCRFICNAQSLPLQIQLY